MSTLRPTRFILILTVLHLFIAAVLFAHPASGIVVDSQGHVYFVYSTLGVVRIDSVGKLTNIRKDSGGHWLALDARGSFSQVKPGPFERVTPNGAVPGLVFASGGGPLVVASDGKLYYASDGSKENSFPPGALTVVRMSPGGQPELFASTLQQKLAELKDGITGIATGPNNSIYVATWNGIIELNADGSIAKVINPIAVPGCDADPADHNPANASSPLLRGLAVDSRGNVYVAATSCHWVIKIRPDGQVSGFLNSERPWSPTGVAIRGEDLYVLEYTNANGPKTEGWRPRVRKVAKDGAITKLVEISSNSLPSSLQ